MATKTNKNKKKQAVAPPPLTPKQYVKQRARKIPIVHAFMNTNFLGVGLASIILVRQQGGNKYLVAIFMVDVFCMGIKNTSHIFAMPEAEFLPFLENHYALVGLDYKDYDPNYVQNVIWGGYKYGQSLGFGATKYSDFDVNQYILDPLDQIKPVKIPFGKDGKPFYLSGPNDSPQKVIAKLTQKVGAGNFEVLILGDSSFLNQDFDDDSEWDFDDDDDDDFDADNDDDKAFDDYEEIT